MKSQKDSEKFGDALREARTFLGTNDLNPRSRSAKSSPDRLEYTSPSTKTQKRVSAVEKSENNPDTYQSFQTNLQLSHEGQVALDLYEQRRSPQTEIDRVRSVARAKLRSNILSSRDDPNKFIEYCFTDSVTGRPVQQSEIHRKIQNACLSGDDYVMELPRDHGKSTQLEGHVIWRLGNNPNLRIKIVCESDGRSIERLFAVTQHIRSNDRVRSVFPHLVPAQMGDWSKHKIVVRRDRIMRDASVEAVGIMSSSTGGRADLLMADDVCGRRNTLELPKMRETVKSAWDSDWSNLLEPDGQILWICTPWHTADCTHKLKKNQSYRLLSIPVGTENDMFSPVWEEKWGRRELKKRFLKIGQREYDRGFRLRALSGDVVVINPEWISYWDRQPHLGNLNVFIAFDQSSGEGNDFFACVVVGVDVSTLKIFVLDAWHSKLTFLKRAESIKKMAAQWIPNMMGIEQSSLKSLTQFLDATTMMKFIPLRPHLSKIIRLSEVTPFMERGQVFFNPALNPDNILDKDSHGDLVSELLEFPLAKNDDLVDAFVHCINLASSLSGVDSGVGINVHQIGKNTNDDDSSNNNDDNDINSIFL